METECTFQSTELHLVKRAGFQLTHARYMTATAAQGQTLRAGVTINCARIEPQGKVGMSDDNWWLNLYVMFFRVTQMDDMLLLRPPPRELLKRGPPERLRQQLLSFDDKAAATEARTRALATTMRFVIPSEDRQRSTQA